MNELLPVLLVPGLCCSARLYGDQIPALWPIGQVTIANHTRDDSMGEIARRILSTAPPAFALVGLSMGGYIAFEILRQEPQRIVKLVLLGTTARPDTAEQSAQRLTLIQMAENGQFAEIPDLMLPRLVHPSRQNEEVLRQLHRDMAEQTGEQGYVRQQ